MKLKMPKFEFDFSEYDTKKPLEDVWHDTSLQYDFEAVNDFPFNAYITADGCDKGYYVFGYISKTQYSNEEYLIVESETYWVKTTRQLIAAYKKVEKELKTKWKAWVKENLYEEVAR